MLGAKRRCRGVKIKQVSDRTGLAQSTIRYYESQGLISPGWENKNGKRFRDYSDLDLDDLAHVAALRRAMFTVEEIRSMQDDPDQIPRLLEEYRQRMELLAVETAVLARAARSLEPEACGDFKALAEQMETAARRTLAPKHSIEPRFGKYDPEPLSEAERQKLWQAREDSYASILLHSTANSSPAGSNTRMMVTDSDLTNAQRIGMMKALRGDLQSAWSDVGQMPDNSINLWRYEKMERKRPLSGIICTILSVVLVLGSIGTLLYFLVNYQRDFVPGEYYEQAETLSRRYSTAREKLTQWGVDFNAVPGSHGQVLTFRTPKTVNTYKYGLVKAPYRDRTLLSGTEMSCDFAVYSEGSGNASYSYKLIITVDGEASEVTMKRGDVAALYRAALEQNGLAEQFQADTGEKLTRRSAKKALQSINQQIYELGIYPPAGYPYNQERLAKLFVFSILLSPLFVFAMGAIWMYILMVRADRAFLKAYNTEHTAHWDEIQGTLPQFTSYAASGIRGPGEKPKLRDVFRAMFQPMEK